MLQNERRVNTRCCLDRGEHNFEFQTLTKIVQRKECVPNGDNYDALSVNVKGRVVTAQLSKPPCTIKKA